jgi:hypothetical protein
MLNNSFRSSLSANRRLPQTFRTGLASGTACDQMASKRLGDRQGLTTDPLGRLVHLATQYPIRAFVESLGQ